MRRISDNEILYLRFLNNTLQIKRLREDICDEFTRKVFDYLEDSPLFDAQVFSAFLYHFIFKCHRYRGLIMTAEHNMFDRIRLKQGTISNELFSFLNRPLLTFALPSVDPNQFYGYSLEDKLGHLVDNDKPSWKEPSVKIVLPEMRGNTGIVPYVDLEFTLPPLSTEQKLDIIHFAICALNYLSQKNEPVETYSNPEISSLVLVSKPEHLKVVSDNLIHVRDFVIHNVIRAEEGNQDDLEFDESLPEIDRILIAQKQDPQIEKQWLDENSPIFTHSEAKIEEENIDEKLGNTLTNRQWLIAMRFFINHFQLQHINTIDFARLLTVLNGGKNLHDFRAKLNNEGSLITSRTKEDAMRVATLYRDCGLNKVADEIERAVSQIKNNNL